MAGLIHMKPADDAINIMDQSHINAAKLRTRKLLCMPHAACLLAHAFQACATLCKSNDAVPPLLPQAHYLHR